MRDGQVLAARAAAVIGLAGDVSAGAALAEITVSMPSGSLETKPSADASASTPWISSSVTSGHAQRKFARIVSLNG